jgi:hypothetical protein
MQNNVKRSLLSATVSVLMLAILTLAYFLTLDFGISASSVPDTVNQNVNITDINGVKYLGNGFEISEYTRSVKKGETAKITVSSENNISLNISVYYASGKSTSSVFSPKTVDKNTNAEWKWTVPSNSSTDKIRVVIRSADTYATLYIDVL